MKILYCYWGENSKEDCIECMQDLGWNVEIFTKQAKDLTVDEAFKEDLRSKLFSGSSAISPAPAFDCIFSFDYFPLISEVAQDMHIPYISWVYDSPHLTLQSKTLENPCNHVFVFDYGLVERYRSEGFDTVEYMPLACNTARLNRLCAPCYGQYSHDITFLGSLYNDENNYYDRINYLPDYMKGYMDAIIASQEHIYGMDLPSALMSDEFCTELSKYVHAGLDDNYRPSENEILRNMLRKKVTVNERHNLLKLLADSLPGKVDLYAPAKPPKDIYVNYKGYADYRQKMPVVFATSKINLNITLRSIQTGLPLRIIDILGAGGFLLTNYQAELPEYFEYGKDIIWYESAEDLVQKAAYYLEHDAERIEIAERSHRIAIEEFSYETLLPKLTEGIL